ncbi:[Fe-Fe] hydrogenase large subunit C-terminal domain-containing protein [Pseudothermotoga thermarum]|uniref:Fe-S cluster domain protein n=1 Tax=Pseudothermotoga thermarum DSM 5069 TaxID=688269 RepID=F7YUM2_9THEM|nr:[Fe-Fe] hydrogenase large subunit C-terminal domain-containing protein [Pseudothermotoga thermarum]AEH50207.1 Fe-S cluster domain protein [Pseudothermotoga thermarum DSM 5069]
MVDSQYIVSVDANCQYCYKCLRNCFVKSIKFENEKSKVLAEDCILCGDCIEICPQKAKTYRKDIEKLTSILNRPFMVSIAPSFYAHFDQPFKVISFLKSLGATYVGETAVGAEIVSMKYGEIFEKSSGPTISTACPVVVYYVERYQPEIIPYLANVVSPAAAHLEFMKSYFGKFPSVFIGPCIAKKKELEGVYDVVLTFEELDEYIKISKVNLSSFKDVLPDPPYAEKAAFYPITDGINFSTNRKFEDSISISGVRNVAEFLKNLDISTKIFVELSACDNSCINGPAIRKDLSVVQKKSRILKIRNELKSTRKRIIQIDSNLKLSREFKDRSKKTTYSEEAIKEVLISMGKTDPSKELNCSACGYNTCREKAVAVLEGKAEKEMCLPYLVEKVSSASNKLVEESPNIIFIHKDGKILYKNKMARKYFLNFSENQIMEFISEIERKRLDKINLELFGKHFTFYCKTFELPEESGNVIVLVDVTRENKQKEEISRIKNESIKRIEEVLEKQMLLAQEIASLLGESIAEAKSRFEQFKKIMEESDDNL